MVHSWGFRGCSDCSLPAVWETWVWSLGWEDPLEEIMATHSSVLAWRIPWTEEPGRLQSVGSQRVGHNWASNTHTHTPFIVIVRYWLYSVLLHSISLWLILFIVVYTSSFPTAVVHLLSPSSYWYPGVCSLYPWVCFLFVIFTSLLYFPYSTYKWYHIVFVFLCLTYFS